MNNPFETIEARLINIENLLIDLKHQPQTAPLPEADQLLTIEQAGQMLNLSVATLYDRVHKQTIPVCKRPGTKRLYFSKKALTDFILQGKRPTIADISAQADNFISKVKRK